MDSELKRCVTYEVLMSVRSRTSLRVVSGCQGKGDMSEWYKSRNNALYVKEEKGRVVLGVVSLHSRSTNQARHPRQAHGVFATTASSYGTRHNTSGLFMFGSGERQTSNGIVLLGHKVLHRSSDLNVVCQLCQNATSTYGRSVSLRISLCPKHVTAKMIFPGSRVNQVTEAGPEPIRVE